MPLEIQARVRIPLKEVPQRTTPLLFPPTLTPRSRVCLLKTAIATITMADSEAEANILFDEGSQRSFLTQDLADLLLLQSHTTENICLSSFGAKRPLNKRMEVASINMKTRTGGLIPISVLIVPTIATPLRNTTKTEITLLQGYHWLIRLPQMTISKSPSSLVQTIIGI